MINADTTPDEVGALFTVPLAMTVAGLAFVTNNIYVGTAATFGVTLYAADNTVLPATTVSHRNGPDRLKERTGGLSKGKRQKGDPKDGNDFGSERPSAEAQSAASGANGG